MLSCKQVTEIVNDFVEGRMGWRQRLSFHLHIGMCRACRTYVRQVQRTRDLTGQVTDEPIPPAVEAELLKRFRGWRDKGGGGPGT